MHSSVPLPAFPNRPAEVPDEASVGAVLDAYERHLIALAAARASSPLRLDSHRSETGLAAARAGSPPVLPARLVRHAVAALTLSQALVNGLAGERWPIVRDGLVAGAAVAELGAAAGGLEADEIAAGLASWAGREHAAGRLSDVEYGSVLELAARAAR